MNETKKLIESKTIWGAIIMLATFANAQFGAEVVQDSELMTAINAVLGLIGFITVTYGRIKAVKQIR